MKMQYLAVAFGGALGAMSRFWVYNAFLKLTDGKFPFATLVVNIAGSFLLGLCFVLISEKALLTEEWRSILMVGFLGAFTTFSTFSLDALSLLQQGEIGLGLVYILANVLVCLLVVWAGFNLGRLIV